MATIVNTPGNGGTTDSGAGMMIAIIVLIAVILFGAYWLYGARGGAPAGDSGDSANINVQLPVPTGGTGGGGTGGGTGGTGGGTGGGTAPAPAQ